MEHPDAIGLEPSWGLVLGDLLLRERDAVFSTASAALLN